MLESVMQSSLYIVNFSIEKISKIYTAEIPNQGAANFI